MKAFVAIDSFKGCLSSKDACGAARLGLMDAGVAGEDIECLPLSDGGEGFCDAVARHAGGELVTVRCKGPEGQALDARYLLAEGTAYIESASVCGYGQVTDGRRDPRLYSSYGLGLLISHAARSGVERIVVGLGGTCTCDGGAGMLQALGIKFFEGNTLLNDGEPLLYRRISSVNLSSVQPLPCRLEAWADTSAPFFGEGGAVRVYGAQKGIAMADIPAADEWMHHLFSLYSKSTDVSLSGTGAAGGIGGALAVVLGAEIKSGAGMMVRLSGLEDRLRSCGDDKVFVLTGEGRYDSQTATGKLPCIVAQTARKACPGAVRICLAGQVNAASNGEFDHVLQVSPLNMEMKKAMDPAIALHNIRNSVFSLITSLLKEGA